MRIDLDLMEYSSDTNAQAAYVSNGSATIAVDDFNSYSDGNLNGQGSWSGDDLFQVQTDIKYEGAKAIKLINPADTVDYSIIKSGTAQASGKLEIMLQKSNLTAGDMGFQLGVDADFQKIVIDWRNDGKIYYLDSSWSAVVLYDSLSANTWYRIVTKWNNTGTLQRHQVQLVDRTVLADTGWVSAYAVGSLNKVKIRNYASSGVGTNYWDYLTNGDLIVQSESTIKTQGSYSLKAIALKPDSLNKTLTNTLSVHKNLTGIVQLKFDIRANRTGSNIKIGLHDSGGNTIEITPNIVSANVWQEVKINLQNISNSNKDDIDSVIITLMNADSDNTFYIDNMFSYYIPQIITG